MHFQLRLITVTRCFGQSKLNCFLIVGSVESSRTPRRCLDEKQMPAGSGIFTTLLLLPALFEACLCQPGRIPALHPSPPGTDPAGERRNKPRRALDARGGSWDRGWRSRAPHLVPDVPVMLSSTSGSCAMEISRFEVLSRAPREVFWPLSLA